MRTAQGPFPMETTYTWVPGECERHPHVAPQPRRTGRLRHGRLPVDGSAMGRANRKDLASLKGLLESQ